MIDRFGEREVIALTDRDNVGVVDSAVLMRVLDSASSEIDTYLAGKYSLPLTQVLPVVRDYACDIARYRLSSAEVVETEEVRNRFNDAIKFFEKVANGKIGLGVDTLNQPAASTSSVKSTGNDRVFSKSTLADY